MNPLETAHDAILAALDALDVDPTPTRPPAKSALERARHALFEAGCALDLARLALEPVTGPARHA